MSIKNITAWAATTVFALFTAALWLSWMLGADGITWIFGF